MFHPESLPPEVPSKPPELVTTNTRFENDPWEDIKKEPQTINKNILETFRLLNKEEYRLGEENARENAKKIDLDDLMDPSQKSSSVVPVVNGFSFLVEPTPIPTTKDPIFTWGSISGTPVLLEPNTPSSTPFHVQETSSRDKLAHALADKSQKKKNKQSKSNPTFFGPATPAQRFIQNSIRAGPFDSQLRSSYTPKHASTPRGDPSTPMSMRKRAATPNPTDNERSKKVKVEPQTTTVLEPISGSITDNLI